MDGFSIPKQSRSGRTRRARPEMRLAGLDRAVSLNFFHREVSADRTLCCRAEADGQKKAEIDSTL